MSRLPTLITPSVARSAHQGESHDGIYLVDLKSGKASRKVDWNTCDINCPSSSRSMPTVFTAMAGCLPAHTMPGPETGSLLYNHTTANSIYMTQRDGS